MAEFPLRHNQQLLELVLDNVTFTGKTLGSGSFGSVLEVIYNHTTCAAKQIHEILLERENEGVRNVMDNFQKECQLMARLRHPNITQFLGLFFLEGKQMPLLLIEKLETNLDDVLEFLPNLSLGIKVCILEDVCNGLVYLHGQRPPVIHRDLTATNVLLTKGLTAKISDMGNSRILDLIPSKHLTQLPGTLVYMPPEALDQLPQYGPPLDVFSFGHLALYALTQVCPELKSNTYPDPRNPKKIIARTELERREEYLTNLDSCIGQFYPALPQLVRQSLSNISGERPTSEQLLNRMKEVRLIEEKRGEIVKHLDIEKLLLAKDKMMTDRRLQVTQERCQTAERRTSELERELQSQDDRCQNLERKNNELESQMEKIKEDNSSLEERNQAAERRTYELERQLQDKDERCQSMGEKNTELESQIKDTKKTNSYLEVRCLAGDARIRELEAISAPLEGKRKSQSFKIQWRVSPNFFRSPTPQNYAERQLLMILDEIYIVSMIMEQPSIIANLKYLTEVAVLDTTSKSSNWQYLPSLPGLQGCAMITTTNKLVLVGGQYRQEIPFLFRSTSNSKVPHHQTMWDYTKKGIQEWQHPDIPIPGDGVTNCTATTYQHWLILAGCSMENDEHVLLKLMDYDTEEWYIQSISFLELQGNFRSCLVGDRWYILSMSRDSHDYIHSISLPALIEHVTTSRPADTSSMWKTHRLPYQQSTPLCICDTLFLFGGAVPTTKDNYVSMPTILQYQPETNECVIAGYLPFPVHNCSCAMTSDGQILIIGGQTNDVFRCGKIILNI